MFSRFRESISLDVFSTEITSWATFPNNQLSRLVGEHSAGQVSRLLSLGCCQSSSRPICKQSWVDQPKLRVRFRCRISRERPVDQGIDDLGVKCGSHVSAVRRIVLTETAPACRRSSVGRPRQVQRDAECWRCNGKEQTRVGGYDHYTRLGWELETLTGTWKDPIPL